MYSIITKHRIGKAPTSNPNNPGELAQGFIMKLEANTDPDQANELNRLLDRGDYLLDELVRALGYHFTFGIAELLGRYLMHGYIPTMSPDPRDSRIPSNTFNPESGNYKNELIEELASHYNALAMHAGLEARAYQGSQHQELTGEDWEDRSELIRFETA
tara:strand:- start:62 stop:538 length:477 start_codon:yes stop_codon:yes gene_type:complete